MLDEIKSGNVARLDLKPAVPTLAMLLLMTPMALLHELNPVTAVNIDVRMPMCSSSLLPSPRVNRFTDSREPFAPGCATAVVSAWVALFEPTLSATLFLHQRHQLGHFLQLVELRCLRDERIIFQGFQRVPILKLCHYSLRKIVLLSVLEPPRLAWWIRADCAMTLLIPCILPSAYTQLITGSNSAALPSLQHVHPHAGPETFEMI